MSLNRYPENWKQLALAVKESANWQCQRCGRLCLKPGETLPDNLKRRAYVLQVHHWNLDPSDNRLENLVALCSSCHLAIGVNLSLKLLFYRQIISPKSPTPGSSTSTHRTVLYATM